MALACENYAVCERARNDYTGRYCATCTPYTLKHVGGWGRLVTGGACCVYCNNVAPAVRLPQCCGHWLCIPCFRRIFMSVDERFDISPAAFGCPLPHEGPARGVQCRCVECREAQRAWAAEYVQDARAFELYTFLSMRRAAAADPEQLTGSEQCPACLSIFVHTLDAACTL